MKNSPIPNLNCDATVEIETVQLILKVSERCNLACPYCYYFFSGDESYSDRPPLIDNKTIKNLIKFLKSAAIDSSVPNINIVFHGGEPLMMGKRRFRDMCELLQESLSCFTKLSLSIQTNATLIDSDWVSLFEELGIHVGVSLDGEEKENNTFRVDKKGRGYHSSIENGIKLLTSVHSDRFRPSSISVVNATSDYKSILKYIFNIGLTRWGFLLPDVSHVNGLPEPFIAEDFGNKLCEIFDYWAENRNISIREVNKFLSYFQAPDPVPEETEPFTGDRLVPIRRNNLIIVVHSNGDISVDDSLMPALNWRKMQVVKNIADTTFYEWANLPIHIEMQHLRNEVPQNCKDCVWLGLCKAGDLENRYDGDGFSRESVFCESLKQFYTHCAIYLVANGYSLDELMQRLLSGAELHKSLIN